jgi:nephrocystin-3
MVLEKKYSGDSIASWFYLRDPYFLEEVAANEKHIYTSEGPVSKQRLDALKTELSKRVSPRGYSRPPALAEYALDDLKEHIERAFPADQTLSPLERERFRHQTYSASLTRVYLANEDALNQLDKFVSSEIKRPFVICGEPGIGKSALLANWVSRHIDSHPEDVVLPHFIGSSPGSSNYGNILSRVLSEIRNAFEIDDPLQQLSSKSDEVTAQQISKEFVNSLKNLVTKHNNNRKRVIVVLDGLNKLDDRDGAHDLVWLPSAFPKLVRVIISTAPNFILDVLKKRKSEMMEVKPLEEGQRKSFTRLYLNLMSKQLDEKLEFRISQAPQTANPRYLKTLLDDVAAFGKFDQLGTKIDTDLQASNTSQLYEIVLQRLEQDFDRNVVKNFMILLSASRRGLMLTSELGVILSGKKFKVSEDAWTSFFIAADESLLADCSGLILFANQDVRAAVERRYLRTQGDKISAHRELAEFFSSSSDLTERKVEELPYQLEKGGLFTELKDTLCDLNFFTKLYEDAHKFDLLRYWRELEKQNIDVVKAYDDVLSQGKFPPGAIIGDLLFRLGRFLYEMSKYGGSESVFKKAEHYYTKSSQTLPLARVQTSLAELYFTQGKVEETEVQLKRALSVYEREKGTDAEEISSICNKLGSLLTVQRKYSDALVVLQRALRIAESAFGVDAVPTADVIYNMACTLLCVGDAEAIAKAEKHLLHALEIKELQLGPWDPEVSHVLLRLGELYLEQNQFGDAQECLERSLFIRETKLGPEHSRVAQTLKHMITCYEMQEKYDDALRVGFRALEITKKLFGAKHLHCSGILLRLGTVYLSKEDKANSRKFILEALEMRKELFGATHRWTVEAQAALDSLLPKSAPASPRAQPVERALQRRVEESKGMGGVLLELKAVRGRVGNESRVAGFVIQDADAPPPPPPPMPGYLSAPRAPPAQTRFVPKVAIGGGDAGNFEAEIQSYSGGLVRNEQVNDKANAWEAAKAMLGAKDRKIQFKKKMK